MKVALCLYGKFGGISNKADLCKSSDTRILQCGYDAYNKNLFSQYDVDVYIHSWEKDHEGLIKELYSPYASVFEKQKLFSGESKEKTIRSRHYSAQMSHSLIDTNINYDLVLMSRFDIQWNIPNLDAFALKQLNLSHLCGYGENGADLFKFGRYIPNDPKSVDPSILTNKPHWHYDPEKVGVADFWFAGSYDIIKVLCKITSHLDECISRAPRKYAGSINPHSVIYYWIKKNGIPLNFIHHYVDTPLIRRSVFGSQN